MKGPIQGPNKRSWITTGKSGTARMIGSDFWLAETPDGGPVFPSTGKFPAPSDPSRFPSSRNTRT